MIGSNYFVVLVQPPRDPLPDPQGDPDQPVPIAGTAILIVAALLLGMWFTWKRRPSR